MSRIGATERGSERAHLRKNSTGPLRRREGERGETDPVGRSQSVGGHLALSLRNFRREREKEREESARAVPISQEVNAFRSGEK